MAVKYYRCTVNKSENITKPNMVGAIAIESGVDLNLASKMFDIFVQTLSSELAKGNKVAFKELGVFETVKRKGRPYHSILERKTLYSEGNNYVKFTPTQKTQKAVKHLNLKQT